LADAVRYCVDNEAVKVVRIVHVLNQSFEGEGEMEYEEGSKEGKEGGVREASIPKRLVYHCSLLDSMYPSVRIDCVIVRASSDFGPEVIDLIHNLYNVEKNMMFISCPGSFARFVGARTFF
jgi:hypothetical protein